ncbi:hypothetical protein MBT84_37295 [Streptomyces sp. MBT84]|nr:hypothetical protein [Streptomyces sp. MBT84]
MSVTATDGNSRRPGPVLANALERFECSGALPSIVMKSTPRGPRAISSAQGLRDGSMSRCGTSRRMARKAQPAIAAAASVRKITRGRARVPATVAQPRPAVPLQAQLAAQARHPAPHRPQGSSPPPGSAGTAGRSSARCPRWAAAAVCTAASHAGPTPVIYPPSLQPPAADSSQLGLRDQSFRCEERNGPRRLINRGPRVPVRRSVIPRHRPPRERPKDRSTTASWWELRHNFVSLHDDHGTPLPSAAAPP